MTLAQFRTRVRAYANDPDTGGTLGKTGVNPLSADALIDAIGAEEYKEACNLLRRHGGGHFQKTLISATSSTQQHTWPTDFVRLQGPMVVSDDGTSLEADETVGEEVHKQPTYAIHDTINRSDSRIWVPEQGGFRLIPKVTTPGSKALLLRYEYIPDFAVTSTDVITWPDNHSTVLVCMTAGTIRDLNGQRAQHLQRKADKLMQALLIDLKTVDLETEQMTSSFWDDYYPPVTKQGEIK